MKRCDALLLIDGNKARLVKALEGDNVLAETDFLWENEREYHLRLQVQGSILRAWVDDAILFEVEDKKDLLVRRWRCFYSGKRHYDEPGYDGSTDFVNIY